MRSQHVHKPKKHSLERGFTFIEMLIVVPIALLVVAVLVSAMVSMVSDTVVTNANSSMTYNTQDSLNRIEQDIRVSINFMGTLTNLSSPQGRNDATAPFISTSGDLILTQQATTDSPYEAARDLIYYANQPNACASSSITNNRTLLSRTIYFLKTNADSTKTLWRRTIVNRANLSSPADGNTICGTPYQRNSCPTGNTLSATVGATCQAYDERLTDNVTSFTTTYYTAAGATTTDPTQAITVQASLAVSQTVAGKTLAKTVNLRATRTNDVAAPSAPDTPTISRYNLSSTDYNNPILASFKWSSAFATSYAIQTKVGAGSWSSPEYTIGTTKSVSAPYAGVNVSIRVIAYNDYGLTTQSETTATTDIWSPCTLQNDWDNYGGGYEVAEFTMTSAKVVEVRGLVRNGSNNTPICSLPAGFEPSGQLVFPMITDGANYGVFGRVDVTAAGDIIPVTASSNWVSLSGMHFIPASAGYTWTNLTHPAAGGWTDSPYSSFSKLAYTTDSAGRTQIQGLANAGTVTDGTVIGQTLPSGLRPSEYYHFPAAGSGSANAVGLNGGGGTIVAKGDATSWTGIQQMLYPSSAVGWTNLSTTNYWTTYATGFTAPQYIKGSDGIVTVKGLIKKTTGTPVLWEVIGTLPSGYRPKNSLTFILDNYSGTAPQNDTARINVNPDGTIVYIDVSTVWASLDNIKFYADGN